MSRAGAMTVRRLPPDVLQQLKIRGADKGRSMEAEAREVLTAHAAGHGAGDGWRCFFCGEVFHDARQARAHFGIDESVEPGCVAVLRHGEAHLLRKILELEEQLARYHAEDSDIARWWGVKQSDHAEALRREEEKGYARGLRDGRQEDLGGADREATNAHQPH